MPIIREDVSGAAQQGKSFVGSRVATATWPLAVDLLKRKRELRPDEASQLKDFISKDDGLHVRDGFLQAGDAPFASEIRQLSNFEREDDTKFVLAHTEDKFYELVGDSVWTARTRTSGDYTGTIANDIDVAVVGNKYVFTNNKDKIQVWDGTGNADDINAAALGGPLEFVRCKLVKSFAGRLILLHNTESSVIRGTRVRWSGDFNGFEENINWDTADEQQNAGVQDLAETPDVIIGASRLGNILVIYKERSIVHCVETTDPNQPLIFEHRTSAGLDKGQGLISNETLVELLGFHIGLFNDNVYIYDGIRLQGVGDPVIRTVVRTAGLANVKKAFATVVPSENWYILWVPFGGETFPQQAYIYDYRRDLWVGRIDKPASTASTKARVQAIQIDVGNPLLDLSQFENFDAMRFPIDSLTSEVGFPELIVGVPDAANSIVERMDAGASPNISALWDTGDIDFGFPDRLTGVRRVRVRIVAEGTGGTLSVSISSDGGANFSASANKAFVAKTGEQDVLLDIFHLGPRHLFRFTTDVQIRIVEWEVRFSIRGRVS